MGAVTVLAEECAGPVHHLKVDKHQVSVVTGFIAAREGVNIDIAHLVRQGFGNMISTREKRITDVISHPRFAMSRFGVKQGANICAFIGKVEGTDDRNGYHRGTGAKDRERFR